ncbi:MAG: hypothetical protein F4X64_15595 [Chloroflexi bacterium]|nr:hypothetical protein [Chloroflexota bacterium]
MASQTMAAGSQKLLLVEGADDRRLFGALANHLAIHGITIESYNGKSNLGNDLANRTRSPHFSLYSSLGIVRDADDNAQSAFNSVISALLRAKLPKPTSPVSPATEHGLRVAVLIIPPDEDSGELENLCLRSIENAEERACVDACINCVETAGEPISANRLAKAKVHTYLAAGPEPGFFAGTPNESTDRRNPGLRVGEAAEARVWDWTSPAFAAVADFLRSL